MKTMHHYLGCDISSVTFTACLLDNSGIEIMKSTEFDNSPEGFAKLSKMLSCTPNSWETRDTFIPLSNTIFTADILNSLS